jgi:molecular chaperone DnaK
VKTEIETAIAEAKTAVEGGDADQMTEKTNALTQAAMKLGQAMYEAQQAQGAGAADADAGAATGGDDQPAQEDVVDAEFSEVDDEQKG